jgi:head-tail adaptor
MIAGRLTMRAVVQRNTATGKDAWGQPVPADWETIGAVRCFAWSNQSRELIDGDKTAMIEDLRIMVALGADLLEDDELTAITDRQGNVIIAGRLRVEGPVQRKHTHQEAALKRVA